VPVLEITRAGGATEVCGAAGVTVRAAIVNRESLHAKRAGGPDRPLASSAAP